MFFFFLYNYFLLFTCLILLIYLKACLLKFGIREISRMEIDRISDLPEFILHEILSNLPRKDGARTSVVSKRWNRVWLSFSILDFDQNTYLNATLLQLILDYACQSTLLPLRLTTHLSRLHPQQVSNFLNGVKEFIDEILSL